MFLATNLSFLSQLNLIFYVILGFAILAGFLRGLKKTLFSFITMAIFYVAFFLTIDLAVNFLWSFDMPWLGSILGNVDPSLSNFTSFEGSMETIIQFLVGDSINLAGSSAEVMALATGLVQFVIKIVWTKPSWKEFSKRSIPLHLNKYLIHHFIPLIFFILFV